MADVALQHALHELKVALEHVFISRYMGVAGYALLIYDHILTFPAEVELIWKADKQNVVTWLFFLNRYIVPIILGVDLYDKGGLASHLSIKFCQVWFVIEGYLNVLSFAAVHALVAMRVNAVWGRRKWVTILLWTGGTLYIVGTLSIISPGIFQVLVMKVAPNPIFNVCFGTITTYFWTVWIPPIIFEVIIFTLTIIKAIEHRHKNVKTPVAYILYRDGFLYFLVIMMCSIFPLIVWLVGPPTLVAMPKYFTQAVVNVMGFRLVLNLRGLRGDRVMASSGGIASDDMNMEMSDIKGSRGVPRRSGFSPVSIHVRPGFAPQISDLRVPTIYETRQTNPAVDVRWHNRQVGYADQQPFDRSSNAEKGYPPGFGPLVGLTGGIASGKSTVSSLLTAHGIPVIDADILARQVVEPGTPGHAAICTTFGAGILKAGSQDIDRKKLGEVVFNDEYKRKQLNAIVHPAVRKAMFWSVIRCWLRGERVCVLDIPLLIETGMWKQVGKVIVVYVSKELQMQRLMRRDSSDRVAAQSRVSSQLPLASKLEYADIVIDNSGSMADTDRQVASIVQRLNKETGWTWLVSWVVPPVGLALAGWCLAWRAIKRSRKTKRRPAVPNEGAIELQ
ncbi:dephospho-CoA kinase [Rhizoctonia solani 123E]|uniref:Dephospho-CoA kinase n=1 Tax=Rhizoctonia solani 123E TaxID=1423351 RepID=A0A074S9U8_9AGAM|nr:dephospho-CoA kinase [Rhizoctonia solani 123E]